MFNKIFMADAQTRNGFACHVLLTEAGNRGRGLIVLRTGKQVDRTNRLQEVELKHVRFSNVIKRRSSVWPQELKMSDAGGGDGRGARRRPREIPYNVPRRPEPEEPIAGTSSSYDSFAQDQGIGRVGGPSSERQTSDRDAGPSRARTFATSRIDEVNRELVTRPAGFNKTGSRGTPLDVIANYFKLIKRPDMHLLQYRVDFTPDVDHPGVRKALVRVHEPTLGKYMFDGTLLYNTIRLAQPLELVSRRNSDGSDVKITFRLVGEIQKEDAIYSTVMNLILRRCMAMLNLVLIKRNYYDKEAKSDVPGYPITIWPGYLTSIQHHEQDFLLKLDTISKFLRRDTAHDVMDKIRCRQADLSSYQSQVKGELLGKIVMTGYNNKTYRIDDVDFDKNAQSKFYLRKEDREITYEEYYSTRYQLKIRFPLQALLMCLPSRRDINRGNTQPIYLIAELCGMTGLSKEEGNDFRLTKAVSNLTGVTPDRRVATLMKFRRRLEDNPQIRQELRSWGLEFANEPVQCKARILPALSLTMGATEFQVKNGDWGRNIQGTKMYVSMNLNNWIVLHPRAMGDKVRSFVHQLKTVGGPQGVHVAEPRYIELREDRTTHYIEALREHVANRQYNIVLCVLRTQRNDTYNAIKRETLCKDTDTMSQVITEKNLNLDLGKLRSVATKVMIQMACKLGAEPWKLGKCPLDSKVNQIFLIKKNYFPDIPCFEKKMMVIGYDTYHDAKQKTAVGAFVASTNVSCTRYNSSVKLHSANEEISPSFKEHMLTALKAYLMANKSPGLSAPPLPQDIVIYRDGVGAGDIQTVLDVELQGIKDACREAAGVFKMDYNPGISFVIVSKRVNTRFFVKKRDGQENPPSGTVVDNTVTLSERFDFFLVPQKVSQGTVSPINCNVIHNSTNFSPDFHQALAYALTHVYFNWAGTLKVPAPIQYAHKLAYLVGENIERVPNEALAKYPYYL
ncbi:Aubergine/Piwi-like protein copy E [Daphnia sinensis]|uniref:Aubergine/Piwi-like protein copy E n=1 Tax=Daphnia sinensis TaxID=1820382 RepID=A0AAD5L6W7_9CRUS|nr:Aubergine/Piwi-like protein copy E [Daphnia sinensis]